MGQYHVIVNLSKREYLMPKTFTDGHKLMEFGSSGAGAMFAFGWLLKGRWHGDIVTIAGDYAEDGDYDKQLLKDLGLDLGVSTLYRVATAGSERTPVKKDFLYTVKEDGKIVDKTDDVAFKTSKTFTNVSEQTIADIVASGDATFKKDGFGMMRFDDIQRTGSFSILVNEENGEAIDPRAFGDSGRFMSFASDAFGGTMTALAVLLASSCKGGRRGGGDPNIDSTSAAVDLVGSWADCRISIKPRKELQYCKDISEKMRNLLESSGEGKYKVSADGKVKRMFAY